LNLGLTPQVHSSVKFVCLPLATRATVELVCCTTASRIVYTHLYHSRQLYNLHLFHHLIRATGTVIK